MTIRCMSCGFWRRDHVEGSAHELKYMRVKDVTTHGLHDKMFFCSDSCFLDREFLKEVFRLNGEPYRPMKVQTAMRLEPYRAIIDTIRGQYDDIVAKANKSYGLYQYRLRNGIHDPYSAIRDERGIVKEPPAPPPGFDDSTDCFDQATRDELASITAEAGSTTSFESIQAMNINDKINWADEADEHGVVAIAG